MGLLHAHDKSYKVETQLVKQGREAERVGRGGGLLMQLFVCETKKKHTNKLQHKNYVIYMYKNPVVGE